MCRAALFIIIKTGNNQTFSRWMDKQTMVYWYTGISYLVLKRNELPNHEKKWMDPKFPSERSQPEKTELYHSNYDILQKINL